MNQILEEIASIKELRRDIDAITQRVKAKSPTRERALALTKLQEATMWLGMDLKRIGEQNPELLATDGKSVRQRAEEAYARYGAVTDFKNFRGDPMPAFADLPEKIQAAWEAAATTDGSNLNPYPHSKDPASPVIDRTADGLKL